VRLSLADAVVVLFTGGGSVSRFSAAAAARPVEFRAPACMMVTSGRRTCSPCDAAAVVGFVNGGRRV